MKDSKQGCNKTSIWPVTKFFSHTYKIYVFAIFKHQHTISYLALNKNTTTQHWEIILIYMYHCAIIVNHWHFHFEIPQEVLWFCSSADRVSLGLQGIQTLEADWSVGYWRHEIPLASVEHTSPLEVLSAGWSPQRDVGDWKV